MTPLLSPRERAAYLDDVKRLGAAEARRQFRMRKALKSSADTWTALWEQYKVELDKLEREGK